jgi:Uma2 family endonuclease
MPVAARHHRVSLDEYFAVERSTPGRHEFLDGQIYVLAGGTPRHDRLETRVVLALGQRLGSGPGFVMTSNRRIATADGLYTYADASVFCGHLATGPDQTSTNPVVLVEIPSDSTREYDRGEKLARYQTIPSLRHVVLVEQRGVDVEHWFRAEAGWERRVYTAPGDLVVLSGLGIEVPVAELYDGLDRLSE